MVRAAPPRQSRTFRSAFEVPPDLERGLPGGRIEVSAFVAGGFAKAGVDTVYVSIPERGSQVHDSKAFDDGAVVLDLDARGRPIGVELTTVRKGLGELPGFLAYARKRDDRLPVVMVVTALGLARRFDLALVDSMATMRTVSRQLADQGVAVQLDEMRVREAMVELVQAEPTSRWQPELASA